MNSTELKNAESFLADITQKAQNDKEFKSDLISNPVKVFKEKYGLTVKPDLHCVVEDQSDDSIIYLNIPRPFDHDDSVELTEEQLEKVAGGELSVGFICGAIAGAILVAVGDGFIEGFIDGLGGSGDVDFDRGL
ncbi:hypothetical protein [uncultured Kordia sp.]|uniref:hypothetical protein n=1 Tax=uncultured Kordia sp. TaxID=507699 RepID=UPI002605B1D8|nr:hypothetical protein [uncultured Kordia sp.]